MGHESNIQWCDATHNFWYGCKKVSQGCANCYADRDMTKFGMNFKKVTRAKGFNKPLKWKDGRMVFVNSWSDFFIVDADDWRNEAWQIIKDTPQHTYQILTKRPERIIFNLPKDWGNGYPNVWFIVSCENQEMFDERMFHFQRVKAVVKGLCLEPLIGDIYLRPRYIDKGISQIGTPDTMTGIDWVIVGGESGNETGRYKYRPCQIDWIYSILMQCQRIDLPCFIKQLGTNLSTAYKFLANNSRTPISKGHDNDIFKKFDRHGGNIEIFKLLFNEVSWPLLRQFPTPRRLEKIEYK